MLFKCSAATRFYKFISPITALLIIFPSLIFVSMASKAAASPDSALSWTQTTQADFESGLVLDLDTSSLPGSVILERELDYNIQILAAGYAHTVGLKNDGTVVSVGSAWFGEQNVSGWTDIKSIATTTWNTIGLRSDGTVVGAGELDWSNIKAIAAGADHIVGLKEDGTVVASGDNSWGQVNVNEWKNIKAVTAEAYRTIGLKEDGTIVSTYGEINDSNIKAIAGGAAHTLGLKKDGTVVAWRLFPWPSRSDLYRNGQLDVQDWKDIKAIAAGAAYSLGLKKDGTVVAVGHNYYGQLNISDWDNITAIAAGDYHSLGLKKDGTVVAAGWNAYGQINVDNWTSIRQPKNKNTYVNYGTLTSATYDAKQSSVYKTITWGTVIPLEVGTETIKLQIATNNDGATWDFVGPDGSPDTYYYSVGESIWEGSVGRYIKYKLYMTTKNPEFTPIVNNVTINYKKFNKGEYISSIAKSTDSGQGKGQIIKEAIQ